MGMVGGGELFEMLKDGNIDFIGQKEAYDFQFYVLWASGIIGFVHGYIGGSFRLTFNWVFGATIIVTTLCLPSWPWWNRHPVAWLDPKPEPEKESKESKKAKPKKEKAK